MQYIEIESFNLLICSDINKKAVVNQLLSF